MISSIIYHFFAVPSLAAKVFLLKPFKILLSLIHLTEFVPQCGFRTSSVPFFVITSESHDDYLPFLKLLYLEWDLGPTKFAGLNGETVVEFGSEALIGYLWLQTKWDKQTKQLVDITGEC
jgi:hypothetical protein